ncbi:hypothetical protein F6V30_00100 [Oryzomonas sagensis]|uniref:SIR2-like domain-containing protein n=1 Tax=Oryzomonas sagensis TaxID=2603857 RepID=A0ABQ6TPR4_9BACT|nr:SIR2 family protein [Oryzomonas sagensis]KAB0671038.1 hypothetical protein F6V30_00100 [Oryzomonas sagensis]
MRFLADGPSIPDELLIARDEGRVIFFCGAGVSYARAGLSDFFGLAERVVEALGVTADDPVRKLIDEAKALEIKTKIPGLISADRVFGLLEREFLTRDIEAKVAAALKPSPNADLSAHRIMLDLARSPEGKIRLVTTNFDLLFESCDNSLPKHRNPRIPDPNRPEEFAGIIHLHGHVDNDYQGASGDGFVLSSSEFGDAYLADGWATQFIRSILEKYVVVFVGYAADDPPVHYLLEALNKRSNPLQKMYAFQVGSQNDAEARWGHKGVVPIAYDNTEAHQSLWDTLAAWAVRAVNPDFWCEKIIDMARQGPEKLQPHERGQVAHLVSSLEGARKFAGSNPPPPAEWLCVFDPAIRYLKPNHLGSYLERGPFFDPFDVYGLECDQVPAKIPPPNFYAKREVPADAWNCFAPTPLDLLNLQIGNYAALMGHLSVNVPALPARLSCLGHWICMVSNQPAAVWWASHQIGIYPGIQMQILQEIEKAPSPTIRRAWRFIFTAWKMRKNDSYHQWFLLQASIKLDGWSSAAVRELAGIYRPYLSLRWPYHRGPKPPEPQEGICINDMASLDVQYPTLHERTNIPDKYLVDAVREFRKNLELALNLEKELDSYEYLSLPPIEPDADLEGESSDRDFGIARLFFKFWELFKRLVVFDSAAAKKEFQSWWEDDKVFAQLRIWVAGRKELLTATEGGQLLCSLNDQVFWDGHHQRDLLLVLYNRWNDFPQSIRKKIEKRLVAGRSKYENEEDDKYFEHRAWNSLNLIHWLKEKGCNFSFDVQKVTDKLQRLAPEWKHQYAATAASSRESRGGFVGTDTEYSELLGEPLCGILDKARELSGREIERMINKDPFAGLASERPVRALSALKFAAKRGEWPGWAWQTFLYSQVREKDKPRFSSVIAQRVTGMPIQAITTVIHPVSDWLSKVSRNLITAYREQFDRIWEKVISALQLDTEISKTALVRGSKEPEWVTEALNSPVGKLAQGLMNDPQKEGLKAGKGFPVSWLSHVEDLLGLPDDHRRYALVIFAFNLNWFFYYDPSWTDKNLLSALGKKDENQEAFWDGFFWGAKHPTEKLFFRLKPWLLDLPVQKHVSGRREVNVLSAILLSGWGRMCKKGTKRLVTNEEMRDILLNADDEFRGQIVWHLERWAIDEKVGAWKANLSVFFTEVWPRQKQVKSPKMSAKLCDLTFSSEIVFPVVVDSILPLLTKIEQEGFILPHLRGTKNEIVQKYPEKVLTLLWAVLPDNATKWPYGIGEVLPEIVEAEPALLNDSRWIELKRRWNAR